MFWPSTCWVYQLKTSLADKSVALELQHLNAVSAHALMLGLGSDLKPFFSGWFWEYFFKLSNSSQYKYKLTKWAPKHNLNFKNLLI